MLYVGKSDYEELDSLSLKLEDEMILSPNDLPSRTKGFFRLINQ